MKTRVTLFALIVILPIVMSAKSQAPPPIYVALWFDTEDYVLPQSDDAAKRIAETLTRLGVKATFKVVGEKARVLEQRGRKDVIAALQKHEIGYHSNTHSQQPTVAVYLQHAGWEDGAAEFYRREAQGVRDIERIIGVTPVCYGQPGSAWAPQAYPALKRMGIEAYVDEADHVGVDDQPFYYGGMLNVFKMRSTLARMDLGKPENLAQAQAKFRKTVESLRSRGGGTISIYYHPCEFIHREFWDAVNFKRGANPPRGEWKAPQTQSPVEIERNFRDLEQYVKFIQGQPGVQFATVAELKRRYADRSLTHEFAPDEILTIARSVQREITFQPLRDFMLSGADSFWLLNEAFLSSAGGEKRPLKLQSIYGPSRSFAPAAGAAALSAVKPEELRQAANQVSQYCRAHGRMPDEIWIGARSFSPQDYLATLGAVLERGMSAEAGSKGIPVRRGNFTAERYVAEDTPKLWDWPIFPEGFHAPGIMELARLQAWTLKPALLQK
jgi:peptidoglycan/xylan/chitin deacetylase (PgdA/CDA1 family)